MKLGPTLRNRRSRKSLLPPFFRTHQQVWIFYRTFMEVLQGDRIAAIFASKRESEIEVVEQFLGLLNILMSFPGSTFQSYVSHVVSLTTAIYPLVANTQDFVHVREAIFQVLYTVLLTHSVSCTEDEQKTIMGIFLASFQQLSDLSVFKNNLFFLNDLNKRNRLFSRESIAKNVRPAFLQTLLMLLFGGMHGIVEEDIISFLFELASLDFAAFYSQVLCGTLSGLTGLSNSQKAQLLALFGQEIDFPTFSRNCHQMVSQKTLPSRRPKL